MGDNVCHNCESPSVHDSHKLFWTDLYIIGQKVRVISKMAAYTNIAVHNICVFM